MKTGSIPPILLSDRTIDADARCSVVELSRGLGVEAVAIEPIAPVIARFAWKISRSRATHVTTAGPASLAAAAWGGGRVLHVVSLWPTWAERNRLIQLQQEHRLVGVIVHTNVVARDLIGAGIEPRYVRVVDSTPLSDFHLPPRPASDEVRVYTPGPIHRESGHRLLLWGVGILYWRDPRVRMVVEDRGDVESLLRLQRNTGAATMLEVSEHAPSRAIARRCDAIAIAPRGPTSIGSLRRAAEVSGRVVITRDAWSLDDIAPGAITCGSSPRQIAMTLLEMLARPERSTQVPPVASLADAIASLPG